MNLQEQAYVNLGRKLITLCENNELYNGKDEESLQLWNAAVTAGNKFISFGTTWSKFKSHKDLSPIERKAVLKYLAKDLDSKV